MVFRRNSVSHVETPCHRHACFISVSAMAIMYTMTTNQEEEVGTEWYKEGPM